MNYGSEIELLKALARNSGKKRVEVDLLQHVVECGERRGRREGVVVVVEASSHELDERQIGDDILETTKDEIERVERFDAGGE